MIESVSCLPFISNATTTIYWTYFLSLLFATTTTTIPHTYFQQTIIDAPSLNSRKITASILINSPIDDVWGIITDYNRLAIHVPNLVKSYVIAEGAVKNDAYGYPTPYYPTLPSTTITTTTTVTSNNNNNNDNIYNNYDIINNYNINNNNMNNMNSNNNNKNPKKKGKVRLFQEGAQKIVGFDFRCVCEYVCVMRLCVVCVYLCVFQYVWVFVCVCIVFYFCVGCYELLCVWFRYVIILSIYLIYVCFNSLLLYACIITIIFFPQLYRNVSSNVIYQ